MLAFEDLANRLEADNKELREQVKNQEEMLMHLRAALTERL